MSDLPAVSIDFKPPPGAPCPNCARPRDEKFRCWRCHDRPCTRCGKPTASAFIQMCVACGQHDQLDVTLRISRPDPETDRWVIVLEAEPCSVSVASRVRHVLKFARRQQGMRCVALPNDLPDTARTDRPMEDQ